MTPQEAAEQIGQIGTKLSQSVSFYITEIRESIRINERGIVGSLLIYALAAAGRSGAVRLLLEKGANIETRRPLSGETPLIIAARNKQLGVVILLVENGANLHATDKNGSTALTGASELGHEDIVLFLRQKGASGYLEPRYRFRARAS